MRFYQGALTVTDTSGGTPDTRMVSGATIALVQSSLDPAKWVLEYETVNLDVTVSGSTLTFVNGQVSSSMLTSSSPLGSVSTNRSVTLTGGSGMLSNDQLSFNFTSTYTTSGIVGSSTAMQTVGFSGQRE